MRLKSLDIELAVASHFGTSNNLIVPNISWGFLDYECDLLVVTKSNYAWEIEIKVSRADIIRDKNKRHRHESRKIKFLYFAIPDYLLNCIEHIPDRAGIIVVDSEFKTCRTERHPLMWKNYKLSDAEKYQIARLGTLRIWGLKRKIASLNIIIKETQ